MTTPNTHEAVEARCMQLLAKASAWLGHELPYISDVLYGLVPRFVPRIETMGVTEGLVLYIDPAWLLSDPDINTKDGYKVLGTDLYHECNHVLRDLTRVNALRQRGLKEGLPVGLAGALANIAADCPINNDILAAEMPLQSWAVTSKNAADHCVSAGIPMIDLSPLEDTVTMESAFSELLRRWDRTAQQNQQPKGDPQGQESQGGQDGEEEQEGQGQGQEDQSKQQKKGRGVGCGACGGVAGNPRNEATRALEEQLDKENGRDDADVEDIKRAARERIKEHQASHGIGSTPGFRSQELEHIEVKTQVNWVRELNRVVRRTTGRTTAGGSDYSRARYAKRSALLGVLRPGLIDQKPTVAFIRDTSGSMSTEELNHANAEVISVMKRVGLDLVWFLDADARAQHVPKFVRMKEVAKLPILGRGGTNFIQPIEVMMKVRPRPDVIIYLTDGAGRAPEKQPRGCSFIWCIVPSPFAMRPAPWGSIIPCTNDIELREGIFG